MMPSMMQGLPKQGMVRGELNRRSKLHTSVWTHVDTPKLARRLPSSGGQHTGHVAVHVFVGCAQHGDRSGRCSLLASFLPSAGTRRRRGRLMPAAQCSSKCLLLALLLLFCHLLERMPPP